MAWHGMAGTVWYGVHAFMLFVESEGWNGMGWQVCRRGWTKWSVRVFIYPVP